MRFWLTALPSRFFCARTFTAALALALLLAALVKVRRLIQSLSG